MKKVIAAIVLAMASSTGMASGFSAGNVDLYGWVVDDKVMAATSAATNVGGRYSCDNVDLYGWVVENPTVQDNQSRKVDNSDCYSVSRGNVDLGGWVVADVVVK